MSESTTVIRTPDQRLRVFISSTMKELAEERLAVRKAVEGLHMSPIMFEMGARPHPPRDLYRAYLAQSHIFIGIYWQQYGWVAPDMDISGLEDEFRLADDHPKLIYIKSPAPDRDDGLKRLLKDIKNAKGVSYKYFSTPEELGVFVRDDLALLLTERFEQASLPAQRPPTTVEAVEPFPSGSQLPQNPNPLIGRTEIVQRLRGIVSDDSTRIITLTGPGGVGKTSLALEVAASLGDHFPDGISWIPLASIHDPEQVVAEIARALDVREREGVPLASSLVDYMRDREMLLVLDNFEQVIRAGTEVFKLIAGANGVKTLVTSRAPLRVRAEREFPLPPLETPEKADENSLDTLGELAAVRLFVARAQAVDPTFALNQENASLVSKIVRQLDGLPLAIELAAARVRLLPLAQLLDRLKTGIQLLSGGARDLPERQRTMQNAIGWSYDLLDEPTRTLFRRLSLFEASFSLEAAEQVVDSQESIDVLDGMQSLIDNSMLRKASSAGGQIRFNMLEVIREFAFEQLTRQADYRQVQQRWVDYFHQLALQAELDQFSQRAEEYLEIMDADFDNFRAVIEWLNSQLDQLEKAWDMIITLVWVCYRKGYLHLARGWLARALEQSADLGEHPLRAKLLGNAGLTAMWQSDLKRAEAWMDEAVPILRQRGSTTDLALALFQSGVLGINQGNPQRARPALEEVLAMARRDGMHWFEAIIRLHLGNVALKDEDIDLAEERIHASLGLSREVGDGWLIASAVNNLGEISRCRGEYEQAEKHYLESKNIFANAGSEPDVARADHSLGYIALQRGDYESAEGLFRRSFELHEKLGIKRGVVESLTGLACACGDRGDHDASVRMFASALAQFDELGTAPWPADSLEIKRRLEAAKNVLGDRSYQNAYVAGEKLGITYFSDLFRSVPSVNPE